MRKKCQERRPLLVGFVAVMAGCMFSSDTVRASALALSPARDKPTIEYLPAAGETHVSVRLAPRLCVALLLPRQWTVQASAEGSIRLSARGRDGEIAISSRSLRELSETPSSDPIERDAAFLQRDHEDLLGRPAQASTLEAVGSATRWTATWIDASLPAPSHMLTVETYILPAASEWLLEVSVSEIHDRAAYAELVGQVLAGIRATRSMQCDRMS